MKAILCKLFGHTQDKGWWGDALYGNVEGGSVDGIGRKHFHITLNCDRCGERYVAARFHGSQVRP